MSAENKINRVQLDSNDMAEAMKDLSDALIFRLGEKGFGTMASRHEIMGTITEEYDECKDALRSNDPEAMRKELLDIAVGAVWGAICIKKETTDW